MNNFTSKQVFFLYSYEIDSKEIKKINSFLNMLEDSGISEIINEAVKSDNPQGRYPYNPYDMFAMILYAFSFGKGSLREIERACKMSIDYMYIMSKQAPSYVAIGNYINDVFVKHISKIIPTINKQIAKEMTIEFDDLFLDGSKFEANSNKYKFVWKPDKRIIKLSTNIRQLLLKYSIVNNDKVIKSNVAANLLTIIHSIASEQNINVDDIVTGKGHRLNPIQRDYIQSKKYLTKLLEYEEQIRICGPNRNSYYKTDFDATAMCLKEDYYSGLGSNMHAAYNVQFLVIKGLILDVFVSQDRNDYLTLIPAIENFKLHYGTYPKNICADSGYGSHNNYKYINEHKIGNYVKYPLWEKEKNGKYPQLFKINDKDEIVCLNNKVGIIDTTVKRHPKTASSKHYRFTGCRRCIYKNICKRNLKRKSDPFRIAEINKDYIKEIEQVKKNLLSTKGIELRVNRSIQVEGDFGITKQDMSYDRFRRRGLNKVSTEISLVALGINIRKYFRFIETKEIPKFWEAPSDLVEEEFEIIKMKPEKKKQKSKNQEAKDEYKYKTKRGKKSET